MILETLKETGGGRVVEIVEETDLSKGAVYKHPSTLMDNDFVVKRETSTASASSFWTTGVGFDPVM